MTPFNPVEILIVEDNPEDAELTIRALKKHNLANSIQVVEDGEEALEFIFGGDAEEESQRIKSLKVIFLDLKLPKISGLEVLKALKSHEQTKTLPVVVITSSKEDPDIQSAYDLGTNSYIVKPVDFDSFIQAISQTGLYWLQINIPPKPVN
jgi:two-component system response regulator